MRIAVTGASGFIGRHVLKVLSEQAVEVVATSRSNRSINQELFANIRWVIADLEQAPEGIYARLGCPDVVIHLAWSGLPNYRSLHHFEVELPRQYRFLSALIREGLTDLVTVGTCFEYGMQSGALAAEMQTQPNNPYGFAKDTLRKQLQYLRTTTAFNLTWARLFYMYGEGQPQSSLLPMLERAVMTGQQVFEMSGGEQLRDYLPVTEVASRVVALALAPTKASKDVINICSGKPVSVRSLVETWIKERNWQITLALGKLPYPDYEPMAFWGIDTLSLVQ